MPKRFSLPFKIIISLVFLFGVAAIVRATPSTSNFINYQPSSARFIFDNKAQVNGKMSVNTATRNSTLTIGAYDESTTQSDLTQSISKAGVDIETGYTANAYTPGLFWTTSDKPDKPKAGIYLKTGSTGSEMYFSTSGDYNMGISNDAMVIDKDGNVGIGGAPTRALDVLGQKARIGTGTAGYIYFGNSVTYHDLYYIGDDGIGTDLQTNAPNFYVNCNQTDGCKRLLRKDDPEVVGPQGPSGLKGPACKDGEYTADGVTPCKGLTGPMGPACANGEYTADGVTPCKGVPGNPGLAATGCETNTAYKGPAGTFTGGLQVNIDNGWNFGDSNNRRCFHLDPTDGTLKVYVGNCVVGGVGGTVKFSTPPCR